MELLRQQAATNRYARCIEVSRRIRWDIDRDVLRGRSFDPEHSLLPAGLTRVDRLPFLDRAQRRLMSQIQGRTYANMFGVAERFIAAKTIDLGRAHALGNQLAFEALIRFTDEELKHQELFRRVERLAADGMPHGYRFVPQPNAIASAVLGRSTWAVIALTYQIELFTQAHYRQSIDADLDVSPLFKDVLFFHWKEESQHAIVDELEWQREDVRLSEVERERGVDDFVALIGELDKVLQLQMRSDVDYFCTVCGDPFSIAEREEIEQVVLGAYRWQYVVSGVRDARFVDMTTSMLSASQLARIDAAVSALAS